MKVTRRVMASLAFAFVAPQIAFAQVAGLPPSTPSLPSLQPRPSAPSGISLTLDDAITRGLVASHRLEEAGARHEATAAAVDTRHSAALPQVAALGGYMRTNHVEQFGILTPTNQLKVIYPDIPDNVRGRLDVQWPVYTGGRVEALTEAARQESAATAADIEALRSELRLEITRSFWTLVVAEETLRVVEESLARMGAHVRDVRNQLDAGLVPPNEVLSAQAQQSRQRMLAIQARSTRDIVGAELARLVGLQPGTELHPDAVLEPVVLTTTADTLFAQAQAERRDRRALVARLGSAESRQQVAAGGKRPTIALAGGVDYARPNPKIFPRQGAWKNSWDAGVNVSWPLFDGGRTRAEAAEAAASKRVVEARLAEFDSVLALEIRQRLAEIESSQATIAAAEDGARAATEAYRVVGDRFRAGVATSTDVIDAQVAVLQAGLDRTQALANARLADARLHRALGQ